MDTLLSKMRLSVVEPEFGKEMDRGPDKKILTSWNIFAWVSLAKHPGSSAAVVVFLSLICPPMLKLFCKSSFYC